MTNDQLKQAISMHESGITWKLIATILLSVLFGGCSYGSEYEANKACHEWKRQNDFFFEVKREVLYNMTIPYSNRKCEVEASSNTVLGFEAIGAIEDKVYEDGEIGPSYDLKKRFNF